MYCHVALTGELCIILTLHSLVIIPHTLRILNKLYWNVCLSSVVLKNKRIVKTNI